MRQVKMRIAALVTLDLTLRSVRFERLTVLGVG